MPVALPLSVLCANNYVLRLVPPDKILRCVYTFIIHIFSYNIILILLFLSKLSIDVLVLQDFVYGQQKWNVSFVRSDRHLGSFLKLTTPSQGLRCRLDFSFTIVNREHFTKVHIHLSYFLLYHRQQRSLHQGTHTSFLPIVNREHFTKVHIHLSYFLLYHRQQRALHQGIHTCVLLSPLPSSTESTSPRYAYICPTFYFR